MNFVLLKIAIWFNTIINITYIIRLILGHKQSYKATKYSIWYLTDLNRITKGMYAHVKSNVGVRNLTHYMPYRACGIKPHMLTPDPLTERHRGD